MVAERGAAAALPAAPRSGLARGRRVRGGALPAAARGRVRAGGRGGGAAAAAAASATTCCWWWRSSSRCRGSPWSASTRAGSPAPPFLRALALALVLLNPWAPQMLALLGLFDTWADFRKWAEPPPQGQDRSGPKRDSIWRTNMEVILRDDVDKLGRRGEIVKVAEGYGRNFLLPRGLAMAVNDANKAMIDKERKAHEARLAKEKAEFESAGAAHRDAALHRPAQGRRERRALRLGHLGRHRGVPEGEGHRDRQAQGPARRADQEPGRARGQGSSSTPRSWPPSSCWSPRKLASVAGPVSPHPSVPSGLDHRGRSEGTHAPAQRRGGAHRARRDARRQRGLQLGRGAPDPRRLLPRGRTAASSTRWRCSPSAASRSTS